MNKEDSFEAKKLSEAKSWHRGRNGRHGYVVHGICLTDRMAALRGLVLFRRGDMSYYHAKFAPFRKTLLNLVAVLLILSTSKFFNKER